LLGNGDGTFNGLVDISAFDDGTSFVVGADVDGDGVLDVVSASANDAYDGNPNLKVSIGKGDGTFKSPTNYTVGKAPVGIAQGDLDGNKLTDVVVADAVNGASVLLSQSKGTFGAPVVVGSGALSSVVMGDVNGDGKTDIVLGATNPPAVQVLLGKGNGTFAAALTTTLDLPPSAMALGDVNGNGKLDLVVSTGDIEVLSGKGDGTFALTGTLSAAGGATGVTLGDLDKDGLTDLVVTSDSPMSVLVFFGNGDGTFQGKEAFATSIGPMQPAIADFNGDGRPDVIVCNSGGDTTLLLGACSTLR
jgi:hypothetical protein